MKKLISLTSAALLLSSSVLAQDAAQLKEMSMQACDAQTAQLPEEQRAMALKVCTCTVDNTDYAKLTADSQAGDLEKVQADALAVAQKCAEDNGAG